MRFPTRFSTLAALAAVATLSGMTGTSFANEEHVTFSETIRCSLGVCAMQRKTIPVLETVRARDPGSADSCVEYTRRLTGFKSYAYFEPSSGAVQIPQFEESEKRYFRCAPALVSAR